MDWEKTEKEKAKALSAAAKGSGSRILVDTAKKEMSETDEMRNKKINMLNDLFWTMEKMIRSGEMEWNVAIDDFSKGAKAINKSKSKSKKRIET